MSSQGSVRTCTEYLSQCMRKCSTSQLVGDVISFWGHWIGKNENILVIPSTDKDGEKQTLFFHWCQSEWMEPLRRATWQNSVTSKLRLLYSYPRETPCAPRYSLAEVIKAFILLMAKYSQPQCLLMD